MQRLFMSGAVARLGVAATTSTAVVARRWGSGGYAPFDPSDPMKLADQLSDEENEIAKVAHDFAQKELMPRVKMAYRNETSDREIFRELGALGFLGATINGYGCSGVSCTASGLIARELERVDSGYRSAWSVQSSLAMYPIFAFGAEEQKERFLPRMATGELVGCFGLTEPSAGSDPGEMVTHAKKVDGGYVLNGSKMWISNAPFADLAIIWAKDQSKKNKIGGFLVERGFKGFETQHIDGKLSLRASSTGAIHLTDCFVPDANVLPEAAGLKAPFQCLSSARLGIACGMVGAAEFCYTAARDYTMQRQQFGRPLAATQLVQTKLANMLIDITYMQQASLRVCRLKDEGKLSHEVISILKRKNCQTALDIANVARDMHGGNGIADDYHIMRVVSNLHTTNTYEGTHDIHGLILGRAITGLNAF